MILDLPAIAGSSTTRSLQSTAHSSEGRHNIVPRNKSSYTRNNSYDLGLDRIDDISRKKICDTEDELEAELDDLDIDMEGWDVPTERPTRTTRSSCRSEAKGRRRQILREGEESDTDESNDESVQPRRRNRERVPSTSVESVGSARANRDASESDSPPVDLRCRVRSKPTLPAKDGRRCGQIAREQAPSWSVEPIRRPATRTRTGTSHPQHSASTKNTSILNASASPAKTVRRHRYAALSPSPTVEVREPTNWPPTSLSHMERMEELQRRLNETEMRLNNVESAVYTRVQERLRGSNDNIQRGCDMSLPSVEGRAERAHRRRTN
jgi:hypothetical protein